MRRDVSIAEHGNHRYVRKQFYSILIDVSRPIAQACAFYSPFYTGLADVDTELEQLTVNAGCTPTRILPTHPADQVANLAGNNRSSRLAAPYLPAPEQAKAGTMPGNDSFWFDDGQRRAP